jgi:F-type H+-transporting ATPase subunit c
MGLALLGLGIGLGLLVLGAAYGIGKLAAAAMDGTARQPEAGGAIRTTAIILAALIEGFTFLAIIFVFLLGGNAIKAEVDAAKAGAATKATAPEDK